MSVSVAVSNQTQRGPLLSPRTPNKDVRCSIVRLQHEFEDMYEGFSATSTASLSMLDNDIDLGEQKTFSVSASISSSDIDILPSSALVGTLTDASRRKHFLSHSLISAASSVWSGSSRALSYSRPSMLGSAHTSTPQATETHIDITVKPDEQPPVSSPNSAGDPRTHPTAPTNLLSRTEKYTPSRTYRPSAFAFLATRLSPPPNVPAPPPSPPPPHPHDNAPSSPMYTSRSAATTPTTLYHGTAPYQGPSVVPTRASPSRRARPPSNTSASAPAATSSSAPATTSAASCTFTWNIDALSAPNVAPLAPATVFHVHAGSLYRLFSVYASARADMHEKRTAAVAPLLPPHACVALLRHTGVVPHIASAAVVREAVEAVAAIGAAAHSNTAPAEHAEQLCVRVRGEPMLTFDGYLRLLLLLTNLPLFRSRQVRALLPAPRAHAPAQVQVPGAGSVSVMVDLDVPVSCSAYALALARSVMQLHAARTALCRAQDEAAELLMCLLRLCAEDTDTSRLARVKFTTAELEDLQRRLLDAPARRTAGTTGYDAAAASPQDPLAMQLGVVLASSLRALGEVADELIIAPVWASLAVASLAEATEAAEEEGETLRLCAAAVQRLSQGTARPEEAARAARAGTRPPQRPHTQWARARVFAPPSAPATPSAVFADLWPRHGSGRNGDQGALPVLDAASPVLDSASPAATATDSAARLAEHVLARPHSTRFSLLWAVAATCLARYDQPPADAAQLLTPAQREGACARLRSRAWPLLLRALAPCTAAMGPAHAPPRPALPPASTATARRLEVLLYTMHECQREQARVGYAQHYASGPYAALAHPAHSHLAARGASTDPAALAATAGALLNFQGYILQPMGEAARTAAVLSWSRRAASLVLANQRVCAAVERVRARGALCEELRQLLQRAMLPATLAGTLAPDSRPPTCSATPLPATPLAATPLPATPLPATPLPKKDIKSLSFQTPFPAPTRQSPPAVTALAHHEAHHEDAPAAAGWVAPIRAHVGTHPGFTSSPITLANTLANTLPCAHPRAHPCAHPCGDTYGAAAARSLPLSLAPTPHTGLETLAPAEQPSPLTALRGALDTHRRQRVCGTAHVHTSQLPSRLRGAGGPRGGPSRDAWLRDLRRQLATVATVATVAAAHTACPPVVAPPVVAPTLAWEAVRPLPPLEQR